MEPIYLKERDLKRLFKRKVGQGSEAIVCNAGNGLLYKIYHNKDSINTVTGLDPRSSYNPFKITDDSDMKISTDGYKKVERRFYPEKFSKYYDKEGVRLFSKNAIIKAIERQEKINNTRLPMAPIYIEGNFMGCVLYHHRWHTDLHNTIGLPLSMKIKILRKILTNVEELIEQNIYHIDLANKKMGDITHSNILISSKLVPQIIDVDGKSTIYTESPENPYSPQASEIISRNNTLKTQSLETYTTLMLEYIYDIDLESTEDEDLAYSYDYLVKKGVPKEYADILLYDDANLDTIKEFLTLSLKQKK